MSCTRPTTFKLIRPMHFEFICLRLCMKLSPGPEDSVLTSLQLVLHEQNDAAMLMKTIFWNSSIFRGHPRRDNDASCSLLQKLRRLKHKEFGRSSTRQKRQLVRSLLRLAVKAAGYGSLYGFLDDLVTIKDQNHSSQVSQMLISHGDEHLDLICSRQPEVVSQWIGKVAGNIWAEEGAKLAQHLRPPHGQSVTTTIENFALSKIHADAEFIAPTLCHFLALLAKADPSETHAEGRKDKNLVLATVLCILAQTTNEKASEYQTTMGIYLLAYGASRSQFDVLNHAGICLSYRSVLRKIKALRGRNDWKKCDTL
ncbi:hypothetical protein B0H14DRAFT_2595766 [Mycena olivaceomarginata]|nr:hypothetical protein B0H14DRAFT_2595766 [Mycena olivaceomarginata]